MIEEFFIELDNSWKSDTKNKIPFKVIGGIALTLRYNYERLTKDADIIEIEELSPNIKAALRQIAGKGSKMFKKYGIYLDIVPKTLPLLPKKPIYYLYDSLNGRLKNFYIETLDAVDVAISKLKRFSLFDSSAISDMVKLGVINPKVFEKRFIDAIDNWKYDARADDIPQIIKNFHTVQRDYLSVAESKIELPQWICES